MPILIPTPGEWAHLPWQQRERAVRNARGLLRLAFPLDEPPGDPLPIHDPTHPGWAEATREAARRMQARTVADPLADLHRRRLTAGDMP